MRGIRAIMASLAHLAVDLLLLRAGAQTVVKMFHSEMSSSPVVDFSWVETDVMPLQLNVAF